MAKILRCPACGALWQLDERDAAKRYRCLACNAVFEASKAEILTVPDEALADRISAQEKRNESSAPSPQSEALMTKLAEEMEPFDAPGAAEPKGNALGAFAKGTAAVLLVLAAAAAGLLYGNRAVLDAVPLMRPVYESVCGALPCPGFYWANPSSFRIEAELTSSTDGDPLRPIVSLRLRNESAHPQALPIVELKLLDPAGDVIAQRVLEPDRYGHAESPAVAEPGIETTGQVIFRDPLPYAPASAAAAPVEYQ